MTQSSHTLSNTNNKRVGNENCKKFPNKHSFEDIKKMCKEKLNTLTDCTSNHYNVETLRRNVVLVTKYCYGDNGRRYIIFRKQMFIQELQNYVNKEFKISFPHIHSYTDGLHNTHKLALEEK